MDQPADVGALVAVSTPVVGQQDQLHAEHREGAHAYGSPPFTRADDRPRTGDLNLGKVALYQLSYVREEGPILPASPARGHAFSEPPGDEGRS